MVKEMTAERQARQRHDGPWLGLQCVIGSDIDEVLAHERLRGVVGDDTELDVGKGQAMKKQSAASPVMGLWACNFVWDPGPRGAQVGNKVDLYRQDQQPKERCIDR
uniref:Uncharacterized protein n=1 Tax=Oryza brachyantha TaxID=4533 RepID=J3N0G8_ORYBR